MRYLLALALLFSVPAFSQTLNFNFATANSTPASVIPTLTWSTAPAGAQCVASASPAVTGWSGAKNSSGTQVLPVITATNGYTLTCTWPGSSTAVLNWTAPTTNTDGSALTNLTGYRIQYGRTNNESGLDTSVYTSTPGITTWTSPALASGVWYFGVKAVNAQGLESGLSNIASKTLASGAVQTRNLEVAIKFPSAPTGVE